MKHQLAWAELKPHSCRYEIGNPMALYVAVPYLMAHKKEATAGVLWWGRRLLIKIWINFALRPQISWCAYGDVYWWLWLCRLNAAETWIDTQSTENSKGLFRKMWNTVGAPGIAIEYCLIWPITVGWLPSSSSWATFSRHAIVCKTGLRYCRRRSINQCYPRHRYSNPIVRQR